MIRKLTTTFAAVVLFAGLAHAAETKAHETPAAPAKSAGEKPAGDLHALMKSIGKDFKALNKTLGEADRVETNRALAKNLIANSVKCAELVPAKAAKQPEGERPQFVGDYKTEIGKLTENFKKIDAALAAKDFDAAKSAADDCKSLMKDDHRKFIEKKK